MPFVDTPLSPAQTHPMKVPHPSLRNLSPFGYLALGFVIIAIAGVLCYAVYNFVHALNRDTGELPQYVFKKPAKTKRVKKKLWHHSREPSCSQEQPILSEVAMEFDSTESEPMTSVPLVRHAPELSKAATPPVLAIPSAAAIQERRIPPPYDMHKIRFASPSATAIYAANPKLTPVSGSTMPLSYASDRNLFPNLFGPVSATNQEKTVGTTRKRSLASSLSSAFRGKGKGKGKGQRMLSNKENYGERSDAELMPLNVMSN